VIANIISVINIFNKIILENMVYTKNRQQLVDIIIPKPVRFKIKFIIKTNKKRIENMPLLSHTNFNLSIIDRLL
jgi:hypothetical protein